MGKCVVLLVGALGAAFDENALNPADKPLTSFPFSFDSALSSAGSDILGDLCNDFRSIFSLSSIEVPNSVFSFGDPKLGLRSFIFRSKYAGPWLTPWLLRERLLR